VRLIPDLLMPSTATAAADVGLRDYLGFCEHRASAGYRSRTSRPPAAVASDCIDRASTQNYRCSTRAARLCCGSDEVQGGGGTGRAARPSGTRRWTRSVGVSAFSIMPGGCEAIQHQQLRTVRLGVLNVSRRAEQEDRFQALAQRLDDRGWRSGHNLVIDRRWGDDQRDAAICPGC
jgi:hypothetical protein